MNYYGAQSSMTCEQHVAERPLSTCNFLLLLVTLLLLWFMGMAEPKHQRCSWDLKSMSLGRFLSWHNYEILVEKLQRQRLTVRTSLASRYSRQQKLLAASARPSPNRSIQARAEVKASLRATCERTHAHPQGIGVETKTKVAIGLAWS